MSLGDVLKSREACELSIMGKIFGENTINFTGLKQTMEKLWCAEGILKVIEIKSKMYQFVFLNATERSRVLYKRPWTFDNQMLVLHPWKKDIDTDDEVFCSSQMWVQAWGVPGQWLSPKTAWKIRKVFNRCLNVVIPKNGSKYGRYVKLLVEVDLTKPLIRVTKICFEWEKRWVSFKYEFLPIYCFYCGHIGHSEKSCGKKMGDIKIGRMDDCQYGGWLRATSLRANYKGEGLDKTDLRPKMMLCK